MIPYGRQNINDADIQAVVDVLKSDFLTQGPVIPAFEKRLAEYCGAQYAVVVNSATSALHMACLAAGLNAAGQLWTSPNTFVASANCGRYCGASVDFVDIDPQTYNLSPHALQVKLAQAVEKGTLPSVLIPVHFAGQSCEMKSIHQLAKQHGVTVIEDASHVVGGGYLNTKIGSCEFSDMTVFSFHPVKIITTGEGGAVLTNREDLYEKLLLLRSHGITRDPALMTQETDGPWYYQQLELGYNYRMTDIQAALGLSQMDRLDEFVARRRYLAARYQERFRQEYSTLPITLPYQHPDTDSAWHLFVIRLNSMTKQQHRQVFAQLRERGIGVNLHYIPVHTQPYYQQLGFQWGDFTEAERYYHEAISLPLYYDLTEEQQDKVLNTLKQCVDNVLQTEAAC
ncbi:MAG: UDP-4-amino-4,6-dideoxy-N-acetyl-beta-L-altrosamine transaminase [Cyanobacteria bacterium]|nr:UDP-4-amino-4,6-dideoxy-N-acetyl-beta-L-altrosamine transaminase [Cyanobacteriota bacterium]